MASSDQTTLLAVFEAVTEAAEARAGLPRQLVFGPHGALEMSRLYKYGDDRLAKFIEEVLGAKHRIEGWIGGYGSQLPEWECMTRKEQLDVE
mmetsp:Transcript_3407/g.4064  ORF Transcript_3407/g.4064 Transcript_3407/m.4064 type:complete len:92 (+) Transcript_3407:651-926(+)